MISQDDQQITIEPISKMCPDLRQFIDAGVDTMAKCFQVFIVESHQSILDKLPYLAFISKAKLSFFVANVQKKDVNSRMTCQLFIPSKDEQISVKCCEFLRPAPFFKTEAQ